MHKYVISSLDFNGSKTITLHVTKENNLPVDKCLLVTVLVFVIREEERKILLWRFS